MRLKGKVAIITAAGSGMGRAAALIFAREGAKVVVADLNDEAGNAVVAQIKEENGDASFFHIDVTDLPSLKAMVEFTVEKYGKLNILYNHAGMPGPGGIEGVSEAEWDKGMSVNIKGGFFATQYAVPYMRKEGGGAIVFTSSASGLIGSLFSPNYSAAKGAVVNMTRSMALRLAEDNIRVNCVCPGPTNSPMLPQFCSRPGEEDKLEENMKKLAGPVPLKRVGEPEEIANAALFLASDEASFITGAILAVDGGLTAQ